jgi:hypothetical protein
MVFVFGGVEQNIGSFAARLQQAACFVVMPCFI